MTRAYKSLLPPNATFMEKALEESIFSATNLDVEISSIWNIDTMPAHLKPVLLPYLAWTMGVEIWSSDMSIAQKEQMIRDYLVIRAMRGTKEAIQKAYRAIGVNDVEIIENPPSERYPAGEPFKFKLTITAQPISNELRNEIRRLTDLLKPLRTKYFIDIDVELKQNVGVVVTGRVTNIARLMMRVKNDA